ncbi:hypothetical protein LZ575_07460 [Antarcticibacterium sp. 1MA-6-2]|uniref:FISUMP domain-containing protein n=1 Tax=Antarcticibacterium sp. 1MA-6-2 TaxID=2908210 RepID=UPI001F1DE5E1|nr:FISUMP domain-containing protein [Antarcticibacterium sp. 1MA-6-2]UJH92355.1 hypothetical protein LZ575_07460 [Antarcticibacterium sp. 1MA-6-2]
MRYYIIILIVFFLTACASSKPQESPNSKIQTLPYSKQMLDGRVWTVQNLNIPTANSFCIKNDPENCNRYGRLYSWVAAKNACNLLGKGWRLPTLGEWQILAKAYGGMYGESGDNGKSAYTALFDGGNSEFNALLGGNREANGKYERLEAHGFYWTATEADTAEVWFINFAKGATLLNKHLKHKV